ncbi:MAG: hypothetical protein WAX89_07605 [Alphaproteobacteria bacterium]
MTFREHKTPTLAHNSAKVSAKGSWGDWGLVAKLFSCQLDELNAEGSEEKHLIEEVFFVGPQRGDAWVAWLNEKLQSQYPSCQLVIRFETFVRGSNNTREVSYIDAVEGTTRIFQAKKEHKRVN